MRLKIKNQPKLGNGKICIYEEIMNGLINENITAILFLLLELNYTCTTGFDEHLQLLTIVHNLFIILSNLLAIIIDLTYHKLQP